MKFDPPAIRNLVPLLDLLDNYTPLQFKRDLTAGATVGVMLIPQGMAYAVLAGLPPVYGLYASIIPLVIYAFLGTSRHLAVGPTAILSLLVIAGISDLAEPGSPRFIQLAILTAFGAGLLQLVMGLFRMGILVNFLSNPVLSGFTSAASVIIIISQIRYLLGIDPGQTGSFPEVLTGTLLNLFNFHPVTAIVGVSSILVIVVAQRWNRLFPSALLVVVLSTAVTALFRLNLTGLEVLGPIAGGLPAFDVSGFNFNDLNILLPLMFVIALVSYMESIAIGKTLSRKHGYKLDPNQELIAMGASKVIGSFFQAFPTTGSFSRSAVNSQLGAKTGVASLVTALIIALTLLFLTPLFTYLPTAVLAAIIVTAVAGLFDYQIVSELWKTDRVDLVMLLVTFFSTLVLGIVQGIAIGVILSISTVIYSSTRPHMAVLGRLEGMKTFRNLNRYPEAITDDDILIVRFDSPLYFASIEYFQDTLNRLIESKDNPLKLVVFDASAVNSVDSTGLLALKQIISDLEKRQIRFYIASAIGPVRDKLKKSGITDRMGTENFFFDVWDAIATYRGELAEDRESGPSPLQTNF